MVSITTCSDSAPFDSTLRVPSLSPSDWETRAKIKVLRIASYLTEPICKVRESFFTFYILNETCRSVVQKVSRAVFLAFTIIAFGLITPFTAPFGVVLRGAVSACESRPFIYLERYGIGKSLPPDRKITLVSHNECYMPAGYCITDGQVIPASDKTRMNANLQKIKELDPDLICLYEVPDICDADYLSSQLSDYPFLIPVAGVRAVGPSSMMYVASKYEIAKDSIRFVPFTKGVELTGRAQYSEKGILSFDLKNRGEKKPFATVISTHLQHSEIPAFPEEAEKEARSRQMTKIAKQIQKEIGQGSAVIFTGDLNQDETELNAFLERNRIDWLRRDPAVQGKATWGGDKWCAELMGKTPSGPLVLDYTWIAGKAADIATTVIGTGYSGLEFRPEAASDHYFLYSAIMIPRENPKIDEPLICCHAHESIPVF